jgi:integrase
MTRKRSYGTGSIVEHRGKAGIILYGRFRTADGQRKFVKLGMKRTPGAADGLTKTEAEAALRAAIAAAGTQTSKPAPRDERPTLGQAATGWLAWLEARGKAPTYLEDAASAWRHHVAPYFGAETPVAVITRSTVAAFVKHLERTTSKRTGKALSPKSIHNYAGVLSGVLSYAVREGWIASSPMTGVVLPALEQDDDVIHHDEVLWTDDVRRLVAAVPAGPYAVLDRALITVAAQAGLRRGELLGLRWVDADLGARRLRVFRQIARGDRIRAPKGRKGRSVPMAPDVVAALLELRTVSRFTGDEDLIFGDVHTGKRLAWTPFRDRYRAATAAAELDVERFGHIHSLRHSFASELARAGTPEARIQEWAGHASPQITRRYLHFSPASDADLAAVDAAFGAPAAPAQLEVVAS